MRPIPGRARFTTSWRSAPASSSIACCFEAIRGRLNMTIALTTPAIPVRRLFLGVERSACGRAWRDRLDERAQARALAIAQRHDVPGLPARILPGRGGSVHAGA